MATHGLVKNRGSSTVTVTLEPVKSGQPVGRVLSVLLPNGKTLGLNYVDR